MPKGVYDHYKIRGVPKTAEHNLKNSLAHKGKKVSDETKKKLSLLYKGKTLEEIHGIKKAKIIKEKISIANKGERNSMFGKKHTRKSMVKSSKRIRQT